MLQGTPTFSDLVATGARYIVRWARRQSRLPKYCGSVWARACAVQTPCATPTVTTGQLRPLILGLIGVGVVVLSGEAAFAQVQSLSAPAQSENLQEVIVTAQKREENIQAVPISMTAVTGEELEQAGVTNVSDIARLVPGLSVARAGPDQNNIYIRGISSSVGLEDTVGYYVDEVPVSSPLSFSTSTLDVQLFDLQRVEVLRGPQGTIYGSGSMGGTIKYVTNKPDLDQFVARVQDTLDYIDGSNGDSDQTYAVFNAPLVKGTLALRVVGIYESDAGYVDRYATNPHNILLIDPSVPVQRDVNSDESHGFRAELEYVPWKNVSLLGTVTEQHDYARDPSTIDTPPGSLSEGNLIQTRLFPEPRIHDTKIANLTADATLGGVDLTSSTSYFERPETLVEDYSKLGFLLLGSPPPPGAVVPFMMPRSDRNNEFVEEIRAAAKIGSSFDGVLGVYYSRSWLNSQDYQPISQGFIDVYGNPLAFFGTSYPFYNVIYQNEAHNELSEHAVFGQGTYNLTDKLAATVGLRYSSIKNSYQIRQWGALNGPETYTDVAGSSGGVTPKFNVSYHFTDDVMVYTTAAKALRAGAGQAAPPEAVCGAELAALGIETPPTSYASDSLWSYELGEKAQMFDRRLTVNGAAYYISWSKIQQLVELQCGFPFVANYGHAISKGAELETQFVATDALTLSGSAGYTNAYLTTTTPGTQGVAGDPLVDVPKWTGSVAATYTRPVSNTVDGFARFDTSYTGTIYRLYFDSPFRITSPYTVVNLRVGVRQAHGGKWEVSLFANNLTNRIAESGLYHADGGADLPTTRSVGIIQPRTIGITADVRFW
jgi:iron complex outermembrane recepter protein